ncbi:GNAT family N-acetyltransferase [Shewanella youngdeokensis]|uniref:GNAT family N-acetyltransferase n=1 Tax=Shewanella youngdeokensis TaxID=2999068 RepID=A0ABZ0K0V4_9GAMM|nr:GNAT family N-acetyltransferase [Shewanella sp. DAU334]
MYTIDIEQFTDFTPDVLALLSRAYDAIPEFDNGYSKQEINTRLQDSPRALLLITRIEGDIAGFKLGYQLTDNTFYSWLGGVTPDYRGLGLAKHMLEHQERWAAKQGYCCIEVKTRNCFPAMLNMLIGQRYQITAVQANSQDLSQNKLHLQKQI